MQFPVYIVLQGWDWSNDLVSETQLVVVGTIAVEGIYRSSQNIV